MLPEQRDMCMIRMLAVWPRPPMADSQQMVWNEHLERLAYEPAAAAIAYLERNSKHRPALSEFHEAYAAQRHQPERAVSPPVCGMCEDGWVQVRCAICDCDVQFVDRGICPKGPGTCSPCPNGCKPMSAAERAAHEHAEDERWRREQKRSHEIHLDLRMDGVRDPSEGRQESPVY